MFATKFRRLTGTGASSIPWVPFSNPTNYFRAVRLVITSLLYKGAASGRFGSHLSLDEIPRTERVKAYALFPT